jgi:hypothetical protein
MAPRPGAAPCAAPRCLPAAAFLPPFPSRPADVKDIKVVVNFDMPNNAEDYVHRIGRTGRAGAKGIAYSFFTPGNGRLAREIIKIMQEANQVVPAPLQQLASSAQGPAPSKQGMGGGLVRQSRVCYSMPWGIACVCHAMQQHQGHCNCLLVRGSQPRHRLFQFMFQIVALGLNTYQLVSLL